MILQFVLIIVLTVLNAVFASSELAVLSCNKTKIALLVEKGNKRAKRVQKLMNEETKFLSTIQVGITLAGFFSSATAAVGLSDDFGAVLASIGIPSNIANIIAMVIVTFILSYFTLVFGELFPKMIARRFPEKTAMIFSGFIVALKILATPFVKLLEVSTKLLARIFGMHKAKEEKVSEEEIISVIDSGVVDGTLSSEEQQMIEAVFNLNDLEATAIMTPRVKAFMIDILDSNEENIKAMIEENYSRVPVYREDKDNIIGIIHLKDVLIEAYKNGFEAVNLESLIRKEIYVHSNIKIDKLFELMKKQKAQMALLTDEFGGFVGLVTIEDLVEEIFGSIEDEYDDELSIIKENDMYIMDGATPLQDINRELDTDFDATLDEYDTIAGYIINELGELPSSVGLLDIDNSEVEIYVLELGKNAIQKVGIIKKSEKKEIQELNEDNAEVVDIKKEED